MLVFCTPSPSMPRHLETPNAPVLADVAKAARGLQDVFQAAYDNIHSLVEQVQGLLCSNQPGECTNLQTSKTPSAFMQRLVRTFCFVTYGRHDCDLARKCASCRCILHELAGVPWAGEQG